jgi:hypothetical protein
MLVIVMAWLTKPVIAEAEFENKALKFEKKFIFTENIFIYFAK